MWRLSSTAITSSGREKSSPGDSAPDCKLPCSVNPAAGPSSHTETKTERTEAILSISTAVVKLQDEKQIDRRISLLNFVAGQIAALPAADRDKLREDFKIVSGGQDLSKALEKELIATRNGVTPEVLKNQKKIFGEGAKAEIDISFSALESKLKGALSGDQTLINAAELRLAISKLSRMTDFAAKEKLAYEVVGGLASLKPEEIEKIAATYRSTFKSDLAADLKTATRFPPPANNGATLPDAHSVRYATALSESRAVQIDALFRGDRQRFLSAHLAVVSLRDSLGERTLGVKEQDLSVPSYTSSFRQSNEREYQATLVEIGSLGGNKIVPALELARGLLGDNFREAGHTGVKTSLDGFKDQFGSRKLIDALERGDRPAALCASFISAVQRNGASGAINFLETVSDADRQTLNHYLKTNEFLRSAGYRNDNRDRFPIGDVSGMLKEQLPYDSDAKQDEQVKLVIDALERGLTSDLQKQSAELKEVEQLRGLMRKLADVSAKESFVDCSQEIADLCTKLSVLNDPKERQRLNELFQKHRVGNFNYHPSAKTLEETLLLLAENNDGYYKPPASIKRTPQAVAALKTVISTGQVDPATLQAARLAETISGARYFSDVARSAYGVDNLTDAERRDMAAGIRQEFLLLARTSPELLKETVRRFEELSAAKKEDRISLTRALDTTFGSQTGEFCEAVLKNDLVAIKRITLELTIKENDIRGAALITLLRNMPPEDLKAFAENFTEYSKEGWHRYYNLDKPDGGYAGYLRIICGNNEPDPTRPVESKSDIEHVVMTTAERDLVQRLFTGERSLAFDKDLANYALTQFVRSQGETIPNPTSFRSNLDYEAAVVKFQRNAAAEKEGIALFNLLVASADSANPAARSALLSALIVPEQLSPARKEIISSISDKGSLELSALMAFVDRIRATGEATNTRSAQESLEALRSKLAVSPRGTTYYQEQLKSYQKAREESSNYTVFSYLSGQYASRVKVEERDVAILEAFKQEKAQVESFCKNGGSYTLEKGTASERTIYFSSLEEGTRRFQESESNYRRAEAKYVELATAEYKEILKADPDLAEDPERAKKLIGERLAAKGLDKELLTATSSYLAATEDVRNLHLAIKRTRTDTQAAFDIRGKFVAVDKELDDAISRLDTIITTMKITQEVLITTVVILAPVPPPLKFALGTGLHGIANFGEAGMSVALGLKDVSTASRDWASATGQQALDKFILASSLYLGGVAQGKVATRFFPEAANAMKLIQAGDKTAKIAFVPKVVLGATSGGTMMASSNLMHLAENYYKAERDFAKLIEGKNIPDGELARQRAEFFKNRHLDTQSILTNFTVDLSTGALGGSFTGATHYLSMGKGMRTKVLLHTGDIGLQLGVMTTGEAAKGTLYIPDAQRPGEKRLNIETIYSNALMTFVGKGGELKTGNVRAAFNSWGQGAKLPTTTATPDLKLAPPSAGPTPTPTPASGKSVSTSVKTDLLLPPKPSTDPTTDPNGAYRRFLATVPPRRGSGIDGDSFGVGGRNPIEALPGMDTRRVRFAFPVDGGESKEAGSTGPTVTSKVRDAAQNWLKNIILESKELPSREINEAYLFDDMIFQAMGGDLNYRGGSPRYYPPNQVKQAVLEVIKFIERRYRFDSADPLAYKVASKLKQETLQWFGDDSIYDSFKTKDLLLLAGRINRNPVSREILGPSLITALDYMITDKGSSLVDKGIINSGRRNEDVSAALFRMTTKMGTTEAIDAVVTLRMVAVSGLSRAPFSDSFGYVSDALSVISTSHPAPLVRYMAAVETRRLASLPRPWADSAEVKQSPGVIMSRLDAWARILEKNFADQNIYSGSGRFFRVALDAAVWVDSQGLPQKIIPISPETLRPRDPIGEESSSVRRRYLPVGPEFEPEFRPVSEGPPGLFELSMRRATRREYVPVVDEAQLPGESIRRFVNDPQNNPFGSGRRIDNELQIQQLLRPEILSLLESDFGVDFAKVPIRSVIQFSKYLSNQNNIGLQDLQRALRRMPEADRSALLISFLASAEKPANGDLIVKAALTLPPTLSGKIFQKYAELTGATHVLKSTIAEFGIKDVDQATVDAVTQTFLLRANAILNNALNRNLAGSNGADEVLNGLQGIEKDAIAFGAALKNLRGRVPLSSIPSAKLSKISPDALTEQEKASWLVIARSNGRLVYGEGELFQYSFASLEKSLSRSDVRFYRLDGNGRTLAFCKVEDLPDGKVYLGSNNVRPEGQGLAIGTEFLSAVIANEGNKPIVLHCAADNPAALAVYKVAGFELIGEDRSLGTFDGKYLLKLERPATRSAE